jgi:hypothetical protein
MIVAKSQTLPIKVTLCDIFHFANTLLSILLRQYSFTDLRLVKNPSLDALLWPRRSLPTSDPIGRAVTASGCPRSTGGEDAGHRCRVSRLCRTDGGHGRDDLDLELLDGALLGAIPSFARLEQ